MYHSQQPLLERWQISRIYFPLILVTWSIFRSKTIPLTVVFGRRVGVKPITIRIFFTRKLQNRFSIYIDVLFERALNFRFIFSINLHISNVQVR